MAGMPDLPHQPFPHRKNEDGSFDSICPFCYRTVASQPIEADLAEYEQRHVCKEADRPKRKRIHFATYINH
jgi:hypothetical protein